MERLKKITADTVFVIQVLILFILVFENRIEVPAILQAVGRLHPLLLHLPIGLLLVTVALLFARAHFAGKPMDNLVSLLLHFTVLTASLTTIVGLLLSFEGTFGDDQLSLHKWMGVALSFVCWSLLMLKNKLRLLRPVGTAAVILLIFTGHYGAGLTHGEDFLLAPLQSEPPRVPRVITDSTAVFSATIESIFESKCYGCHNRKKAKGNLILTSLASIQEGGKNGPLWKPKDAAHSMLMEKLLLPIEHKEHMPPKDKAQLTEDEISFISLWIDRGADTVQTMRELAADDTLRKLAEVIIPRYQQLDLLTPKYTFQFASTDKIEKLNTPNRTVFQIARNEPAIQADFYLKESFDKKYLDELVEVKDQLISLGLSKMPVEDADLKTIEKFKNLEVLNLNNTAITGAGFATLAKLPKLRSLSVAGTRVSADALRQLGASAALEEVYIWNTPVSNDEAASLSGEFPKIRWDFGYVADENEILKLNTPILGNKNHVLKPNEKVQLKHNLPGTEMRYVADGTDPDSVKSLVYEGPLDIGHFAAIRTKAFKAGWLSSDVAEFYFFRQGYRPDSLALLLAPHERFPGEGVETLFDGQKGLPAFYRHPAWIAFKENDLVLQFSFTEKVPPIRHVTLSFAHNSNTICLPPEEMQLWGGNRPGELQLIQSQKFDEGKRPSKARIEGVTMAVPDTDFRYYKLVAKPRRKIEGKNRRKRDLWLMVDEIFLN